VTDFGNDLSPGVRVAVHEFTRATGLAFTPLPDRGGTAVFARPVR
jgi:hypothetical protein